MVERRWARRGDGGEVVTLMSLEIDSVVILYEKDSVLGLYSWLIFPVFCLLLHLIWFSFFLLLHSFVVFLGSFCFLLFPQCPPT